MGTHWAANRKKKFKKNNPNIYKICADHCSLIFFFLMFFFAISSPMSCHYDINKKKLKKMYFFEVKKIKKKITPNIGSLKIK